MTTAAEESKQIINKLIVPRLTMTRASWADDVQRKWLESRVPAFVEAQQNKSTSTTFFPDTHKAWQEAFPTPEPTEKEIEESKGNRAAAVAKKRKYWEKVSTRCRMGCYV